MPLLSLDRGDKYLLQLSKSGCSRNVKGERRGERRKERGEVRGVNNSIRFFTWGKCQSHTASSETPENTHARFRNVLTLNTSHATVTSTGIKPY